MRFRVFLTLTILSFAFGLSLYDDQSSQREGALDASEPVLRTASPPLLDASSPAPNVAFQMEASVGVATSQEEGWNFSVESRPFFLGGGMSLGFVRSNEATNERPIDTNEFPVVSSANDCDDGVAPTCSNWAKFPVGAWARRRTTSVSYENERPIQTVTETRILLKSVDLNAKRYELQYDSTIKLGDVDYTRKSETVWYDFLDVPNDENDVVETCAPVNLIVARRAVPCQTRRVVRETPKLRETTTVWYSPVVVPAVLQKETTREVKNDARSDAEPDPDLTTRELFVVDKTSANTLLGVAPLSYVARSSSTSSKRNQSTTTVFSPSTPGGVLRETTQETRPSDGALVYQTTTVLLDYYAGK